MKRRKVDDEVMRIRKMPGLEWVDGRSCDRGKTRRFYDGEMNG